jgi:CHAT domain-containing protein/Tfp pilus assembly protein PilF
MDARAISRFRAGQYQQALDLFTEVLRLRERDLGSDAPATLTSLDNLGSAYAALGRPAEARSNYERAFAGRSRILGPENADTLDSMANLATAFDSLRDYARAVTLRERLVAIRERTLGDTNPVFMSSLYRLAFSYDRLGLRARAEPAYDRALALQRRVLGAAHSDTLRTMEGLTLLYKLAGRLAAAESQARKALEGRERAGGRDSAAAGAAALLLADILRARGRFDEAETLINRVIAARARATGADSVDSMSALIFLADTYVARGRVAEADAILTRAAETMERSLGASDQNTLSALASLADTQVAGGRQAEALLLYQRLLVSREAANGPDSPDVIDTAGKLALSYMNQGLPARAEPLIRRAVEANLRLYGERHPWTLDALFAQARLREQQGQADQADALYRRVFIGRAELLGRDNPDTLEAADRLLRLRARRGGRETETLQIGRLLVEGARARRTRPISFLANAIPGDASGSSGRYFADFANAAWQLSATNRRLRGELQEAVFEALQDATTSPASQAVARSAARRGADAQSAALGDLVAERETLADMLVAADQNVAASLAALGDQGNQFRREADSARTALIERRAGIDARLRADFADYFQLVQPGIVGIAEARRALAPDEALLIAVPTDLGIQLFAITREQVVWGRSEMTSDQVAAAVRRLRWQVGGRTDATQAQVATWSAAEPAGTPISYDRTVAFALYTNVLSPVANALVGKRQLTVVSAGPLASLPFEIMVTRRPSGTDNDPEALRATAWVSDDFAIVRAPSVQSLIALRGQSRGAPLAQSFVGIGAPELQGSNAGRRGGPAIESGTMFSRSLNAAGSGIANVNQLRRLASLPGTASELERMATSLGAGSGSLFLGARATEPAVRGMDLSRTSILVFATHGLMPFDFFGLTEPGLVLTPPATASSSDDGYLAASEVSALRLNADWVILSACDTATSAGGDPQGLSALSRAFFYAGARNLLATHWPVNDEIGATISSRTVALAATGLSRPRAFQQALREARMDRSHDTEAGSWAHPGYWGPFVLMGEGH